MTGNKSVDKKGTLGYSLPQFLRVVLCFKNAYQASSSQGTRIITENLTLPQGTAYLLTMLANKPEGLLMALLGWGIPTPRL